MTRGCPVQVAGGWERGGGGLPDGRRRRAAPHDGQHGPGRLHSPGGVSPFSSRPDAHHSPMSARQFVLDSAGQVPHHTTLRVDTGSLRRPCSRPFNTEILAPACAPIRTDLASIRAGRHQARAGARGRRRAGRAAGRAGRRAARVREGAHRARGARHQALLGHGGRPAAGEPLGELLLVVAQGYALA